MKAMKIALLEETGYLGIGLAVRFAILGHDVIVGSRNLEKARMRLRSTTQFWRSLGEKARVGGFSFYDSMGACFLDRRIFKRCFEFVSPLVPMEERGRFFE